MSRLIKLAIFSIVAQFEFEIGCEMNFQRVFGVVAFSLSVASATIIVKCEMGNYIDEVYACKIKEQDFEGDPLLVEFDTSGHGGLMSWLNPKTNDDVKQVFIGSSKMSSVPTQMFKIFPNVESVYFDKNDLQDWKREYLKGASKLRALHIWENSISEFGDEAFAEVPDLESLWILENKIITVNPKMFQYFTKLESLDLRYNDFSANLPANVFDAVSKTVCYLNLNRTNMTEIPVGMFKKMENLKKLYIGENKLGPIDASLTFPDKLEKVWVVGEFAKYAKC